MLDRSYWFFGALIFTVAAGAALRGQTAGAVVALCLSLLLVWAGFRYGKRL